MELARYVELAVRFVDGDPLTLRAILGDVRSQMVAAAIAVQDCGAILAHCEEGMVGGQVRIGLERAQSVIDVLTGEGLGDIDLAAVAVLAVPLWALPADQRSTVAGL